MKAERCFRLLRRLLPSEFRKLYSLEMEQAYRDQCREAREEGRASASRIRWKNFLDILGVACREHVSAFRRDVAYALRGIRRQPGFAAVIIITMALGLGANTAIFSVVHSVLLKSLPYAAEGRLVLVWNSWTGRVRAPLSDPEYMDYAERSRTLTIAAMADSPVNLSEAGNPERVRAVFATPNVLEVLGTVPAIGRGFEPSDVKERRGKVAILSDALWRSRHHADPGVLNQALLIDSELYEIVGILPPGFRLPLEFGGEERAAVLLPLVLDASAPRNRRGGHYLMAVGRLRTGASLEEARADMTAVLEPLMREYPGEHDQGDFRVRVEPARTELVGDARPVLLVLLGAVGIVLLIACANVANLVLGRGESRRTEMSIRTAIGASRYRLVRQVVTETCVLFVIGAIAGLGVASWTMRILVAINPAKLPRIDEVTINVPVVVFALFLGVASGILFGIIPALHISRAVVSERLACRAGILSGRSRIRSGLVVAQVALAVILLIGAGLLMKSFLRLLRVPSGFDPRNVLTLRLNLPEARYPGSPEVTGFFVTLLDSIRRLPGVRQTGASSGLPLAVNSGDWGFDVEGRPPASTRHHGAADWFAITPGYFESLSVRLLSGRFPAWDDTAVSEPVIFLNETAARSFFPKGDALGHRVLLSGKVSQAWRRIAGIVGDVHHRGLDLPPVPEMFIPHAQFLHFSPGVQARSMSVVVKTSTNPHSLAGAIRGEIRGVDREIPAAQIRVMDDVVAVSVSDRKLNLNLVGGFAALALVLATVGIYGVMAYFVSERRIEIGVRLALGATVNEVRGVVVGHGTRLVAVGIGIGVAVAYAAGGALRGFLFEVEPTDLMVFAGIPFLLLIAGIIACYIPAVRASRLDPVDALRAE
jgi:putative ABC transport system permease protein